MRAGGWPGVDRRDAVLLTCEGLGLIPRTETYMCVYVGVVTTEFEE